MRVLARKVELNGWRGLAKRKGGVLMDGKAQRFPAKVVLNPISPSMPQSLNSPISYLRFLLQIPTSRSCFNLATNLAAVLPPQHIQRHSKRSQDSMLRYTKAQSLLGSWYGLLSALILQVSKLALADVSSYRAIFESQRNAGIQGGWSKHVEKSIGWMAGAIPRRWGDQVGALGLISC